MTRLQLLTIVVGRARTNGFEFRRWYTTRLALPWTSAPAALYQLSEHRLYFALLFSHEFAFAFWKPGTEITFEVPAQTFQRVMPNGSTGNVTRKPFTRRSARKDAWRYHLREMALAEEPLRYIRKYLNVEDDLSDDVDAAPVAAGTLVVKPVLLPAKKSSPSPKARPLPRGLPAFLQRPYPPRTP